MSNEASQIDQQFFHDSGIHFGFGHDGSSVVCGPSENGTESTHPQNGQPCCFSREWQWQTDPSGNESCSR